MHIMSLDAVKAPMQEVAPIVAFEPSDIYQVPLDTVQKGIDFLSDNPWAMYSASALAGVAVGVVAERFAQRRIERNTRSLVAEYGQIAEVHKPGRLSKFSRAVFSLAAAGSGLAGVANAAVWTETGTEEVVPPTLNIVVDKSGATILGEANSAGVVTDFLSELNIRTGIDTTALVGVSGQVRETTVQDSLDIQPFGDAPLQAAFDTANNRIDLAERQLTAGETVPNSAVIFVTNGNTIGSVGSEIAPTYVVNVSDNGRNQASLKGLSEASEGQYFDRTNLESPEEVNRVIDEILKNVDANQKNTDVKTNWAERLFVSGFSLASILAWARTRSRLTTHFGLRRRRK